MTENFIQDILNKRQENKPINPREYIKIDRPKTLKIFKIKCKATGKIFEKNLNEEFYKKYDWVIFLVTGQLIRKIHIKFFFKKFTPIF